MYDIEKLFENFKQFISVRHFERSGAVIVALPIFHWGHDESIALKITETPDGRPILSDCGTTCDYLECNYINIKDYAERMEKICKQFGLEYDDGEFKAELPTDSLNYVRDAIGNFIEAISLLAYIDL